MNKDAIVSAIRDDIINHLSSLFRGLTKYREITGEDYRVESDVHPSVKEALLKLLK
jgi:hypothetical protein